MMKPIALLSVLTALLAAQTAAAQVPAMSGYWESRGQASRIPGQPPVLTPEAERINREELEKQRNNGGLDETDFYCVPASYPWIMTQSAPINIVQTPSEIAIVSENVSFPQYVYMDGRGHPDAASLQRTINGHSIGRWEGDTLVIDTVGFSERGAHGPYQNTPRTTGLHIVERLRLRAPDELLGVFVIEDPNVFKEPYTMSFVWYRSDADNYARELTCDPRDYVDPVTLKPKSDYPR